MIGAIFGDIVGTPLEDGNYLAPDAELFSDENSCISVTTIMAVAVSEALMNTEVRAASQDIRSAVYGFAEKYWKKFEVPGKDRIFFQWLRDETSKPDRKACVAWVSSAAWLYYDVDKVREATWAVAEAMHCSPDEIHDAEAFACAVYYVRIGYPVGLILQKLSMEFDIGVPAYRELLDAEDIEKSGYRPLMEALACVFSAENFEGALRNVLALKGDIDAVITLAGAVAEAYFGIPEELLKRGLETVPEDLMDVIRKYQSITKGFRYDGKKTADMLAGTNIIRLAHTFFSEHYDEHETFYRLMGVIRDRMYQNGMLLVPYEGDMADRDSFQLLKMDDADGKHWLVGFTSEEECEKGPKKQGITINIDTIFDMIEREKDTH